MHLSCLYVHVLLIIMLSVIIFIFQLTACGFSTLKDVDPNADNFVSACIINTTNVLVGVLLRLEPNYQTQVNE